MHPLAQFKYCPKCGSNRFVENNFKSKKCENCGFIYYYNCCGATVALIFNDKGELLVATRAKEPAKGTFDMPGGFIDLEETAEEGLVREIKEETNLDIDKFEYLFSIPNKYMYSGFEVETIDLFFICHVSETSKLKAEDDVAGLRFMKLSDIDPQKFGLVSVRKGIEKIISSDILDKYPVIRK